MGKRKYKNPNADIIDPSELEYICTFAPAIAYNRQSSKSQIGNTQSDSVEELRKILIKMGWNAEDIILINDDVAVSGKVPIAKRKGLQRLVELIKMPNGPKTVIFWNEDRSFREDEMIEVNKLIKIFKENKVRILTLDRQYHFAHPTRGREDIKRFREQAQRSADYLHEQVENRLVFGKRKVANRGQYAGHSVALGYMVDERKYIDGMDNPNFRKYTPFPLTVPIIRRYFEIFREENGNLMRTYDRIERDGPFIPEEHEIRTQIPNGFKYRCNIKNRSAITGGRMPHYSTLSQMFTNAVYIGYWIYQGKVISKDGNNGKNHEAIIPQDLFDYAFNRLSKVTIYGVDNPNHQPYRPMVRHPLNGRDGVAPPKYAGIIRSDDNPHKPNSILLSWWVPHRKVYCYVLKSTNQRKLFISIRAPKLDLVIDTALKNYLERHLVDESLWQATINEKSNDKLFGADHLKAKIRDLERDLDGIAAELPRQSANLSIRDRLLRDYQRKETEISAIKDEIKKYQELEKLPSKILSLKQTVTKILETWDEQSPQIHYQLLMYLTKRVSLRKVDHREKFLEIEWKCGEVEIFHFTTTSLGRIFTGDEVQKLLGMFLAKKKQWEILRAFPRHPWGNLKSRAQQAIKAQASYNGDKKMVDDIIKGVARAYPNNTTWEDTKEYQEVENDMSNWTSLRSHPIRHAISIQPFIVALLPFVQDISA